MNEVEMYQIFPADSYILQLNLFQDSFSQLEFVRNCYAFC